MNTVEIVSSEITDIKGTSQKTGNPYHIRKQTGYIQLPNAPYPKDFEFNLDSDESPYSVGKYRLHESSIYVDRNGRLAIRPVLTPIKA